MENGKTMVKESWINGTYAFPFAKGALLPNSDPWDRVFYSHQTVMIDSFILT